MLDEYLKIFDLDNNYSLDELEGKYKKLLKEFDTKNIEDSLKVIFLEERERITEAYQILLKNYYKQEKIGQVESGNKPSSQKPTEGISQNKKKKIYAIIGLCSLVVLLILGFVYIDNILNIFNGKGTNVNGNNNTCKIELVDGQFKEKDGKKIIDPSELLECFKNGHIQIDDIKYKLTDLTIQESKDNEKWYRVSNIEVLKSLKNKLKEGKNPVSKEVVNEIQKIIYLIRLESEDGLEGANRIWQWKDNILYDKKRKNNISNNVFSQTSLYIKDVEKVKDLLKFLNVPFSKNPKTKPIPTSVLEDIKEYIKENGSDKVKKYLKTLEEEGGETLDPEKERNEKVEKGFSKDLDNITGKEKNDVKEYLKGLEKEEEKKTDKKKKEDNIECSDDCEKSCCLGCKATDGDAKCKEDHSCCIKSCSDDCEKACCHLGDLNPDDLEEEEKRKAEEKKKEEKKECTVDHNHNSATLVRNELRSRKRIEDERKGKIILTKYHIDKEKEKIESICNQIQAIKEIFKKCTCEKKNGKLSPFKNSKCN